MLENFKKHENYYLGANQYHGYGGEWTVNKQRLHWKALEVFKNAAQELGIPENEDFN